jgi:hypothetical protein
MTYTEEQVTFTNGEITLAGTLTLPDAPARHPAVILLQGSGPLNRDEEAFGMKPFIIIADFFARNGIAVLRYDSRGVGGSTGVASQYTLSDVAEDALAAVCYLKAHSDVDSAQIGLCGHSQGGIVAPMCAAQSEDVAFIICISGIGITGEESYLTLTRLTAEDDVATEDEVENSIQTMKHIVNLVRDGAGRAELEPEVMKMVRGSGFEEEEKTRADDDLTAGVDCYLNMFSSPWFKSFLEHDAQPILESVKCPALLIFGGLDRQVPPEINREAMIGALERGGNSDYLVKTFSTANHLFQSAKTGSISEYGNLGKDFVPGFLELMSNWVTERVR